MYMKARGGVVAELFLLLLCFFLGNLPQFIDERMNGMNGWNIWSRRSYSPVLIWPLSHYFEHACGRGIGTSNTFEPPRMICFQHTGGRPTRASLGPMAKARARLHMTAGTNIG